MLPNMQNAMCSWPSPKHFQGLLGSICKTTHGALEQIGLSKDGPRQEEATDMTMLKTTRMKMQYQEAASV